MITDGVLVALKYKNIPVQCLYIYLQLNCSVMYFDNYQLTIYCL